MKGLEAARRLYAEKGAAIIHEHFPEYEERIAVGLAGSGSQCLGFDDEISRDHDFEPGFCLWLTDEDDARIGIELSRTMRDLFGSRVSQASALGTAGVGVMRISDFYRRFTGLPGTPETWQDWLYLPSYALGQRRGIPRRSRRVFAHTAGDRLRNARGCSAQKACRAACSYGAVGAI